MTWEEWERAVEKALAGLLLDLHRGSEDWKRTLKKFLPALGEETAYGFLRPPLKKGELGEELTVVIGTARFAVRFPASLTYANNQKALERAEALGQKVGYHPVGVLEIIRRVVEAIRVLKEAKAGLEEAAQALLEEHREAVEEVLKWGTAKALEEI